MLILNSNQATNLSTNIAKATRTGTNGAGQNLTLASDAGSHVDGKTVAGFGFINTSTTPTIPTIPTARQGTIVGRFVF